MTSDSVAFSSPGRTAWATTSHRHRHHHHRHDESGEGERHGGGRHGGHRSEGRHGGPRGGRAAKAAFARELARQWAFARGKGGHGRLSPEEIEELVALRRMRGGPFSGPGPFGPRGRGRGRGGRRRRGDVRLAVLRLLAEEPANGYQLMQTIEERTGGDWRPSPGSMYPTLSQLEDEGLIHSAQSEGSRVFELTDAGREHLETRSEEPDPWQADAEDAGELSARDLKSAIAGIAAAAWQVAQAGDERQRTQARDLLVQTRRSLYRILAQDDPDGEDSETSDV